jgi:major vault protein
MTYMLQAHEDLWHMKLPSEVDKLLTKFNGRSRTDTSRAVTFQVPFNSAVQVFNYKKKGEETIRFGPSLVMLKPDEQFTVSNLSGSTPKRQGVIKTLHLLMGPTFSKDLVQVETSDHARLNLILSYQWKFAVNREDQEDSKRVFNIPDFIGDMCNALAAKVRAAVAQQTYEQFHRQQAFYIRKAIFGTRKGNPDKINDDGFTFQTNGLKVINVDIYSVSPESKETQMKLKNSVNQSIKIQTNTLAANF